MQLSKKYLQLSKIQHDHILLLVMNYQRIISNTIRFREQAKLQHDQPNELVRLRCRARRGCSGLDSPTAHHTASCIRTSNRRPRGRTLPWLSERLGGACRGCRKPRHCSSGKRAGCWEARQRSSRSYNERGEPRQRAVRDVVVDLVRATKGSRAARRAAASSWDFGTAVWWLAGRCCGWRRAVARRDLGRKSGSGTRGEVGDEASRRCLSRSVCARSVRLARTRPEEFGIVLVWTQPRGSDREVTFAGKLDADEPKLWSKSSISNGACILGRCPSIALQLLACPLNRPPMAALPSPYGSTVASGWPSNPHPPSACSFSAAATHMAPCSHVRSTARPWPLLLLAQ